MKVKNFSCLNASNMMWISQFHMTGTDWMKTTCCKNSFCGYMFF